MAIDVVLPQPLTPQTMMTVGPAVGEADRGVRLGHQFLELRFPGLDDLFQRDDAAAEVGGDFLDDLLDGVVAHVGLEEDVPAFRRGTARRSAGPRP